MMRSNTGQGDLFRETHDLWRLISRRRRSFRPAQSWANAFWIICLTLLALPFADRPDRSQEFRASIIGQVVDPSGRPIPEANVTAVQHNTHQTYTAKCDGVGVYSLAFVLPGEFTVSIEAQGFKQAVYPNVTLEAGQKLNLNVTLSLGQVRQEVTVTASPGLLDTADASGGGVVNQTKVEDLANVGRMVWTDFTFVEGVRLRSNTDSSFQEAPIFPNAEPLTVNGSPITTNAYFVDGAPVSNGGIYNYTPSQDAVEEAQATVAGGAEYGPAAGGVFNSVIKQGTNKFHGNLFDYYSNAVLDSNLWGSNLTGIPRAPNTRNNFGGTVGGPIQRNKTFFFFSYEGFRQNQPLPEIDSVPTAAMREGNFTGTGYTIYDPSTVTCVKTSASGCTTYGRTAFANDTIPASEISNIGAAIMSLYPMPNVSGVTSNYAVPGTRFGSFDNYLGRVDHSFSDRTRLYGMFAQNSSAAHRPSNAFPTVANTDISETLRDTNAIVDLNRTLSPTLVADFTASFSRYYSFSYSGLVIQQNYSVPGLTMPFVPTTTHQNLAPTVAVTNYTSLFGDTANGTVSNLLYLSPSMAQVKGRHSFHYGFQFMDNQSGATGVPSTPYGAFTFGGNWTQANPLTATTGTGNALADLLLGYPASGSVGWGINDFITYHYYAAYFQDAYKVRSNLTLNLGLRWEAASSPAERHNGINGSFCFTCTNPYTSQINYTTYPTLENPLTGGLTFAGVTAPHAPHNVVLSNWQPRVGIAWAITPKTVFRAGVGIYSNSEYAIGENSTTLAETFTYATATGFSQTTSYVPSLNGNVNPTNYFLAGTAYPSGVIAPTGSSAGLGTSAGNAISYYSPSGYLPWTQHWSAGFQRELPKKVLVDVEYDGSHTHPIDVAQPWGVISTAQQQACFANNAVCNASVANPFYGVLPAAATLGASKTLPAYELMRQQPLFNGITQNNNPVGYSVYNALQVRVERKIKSLDFVANYVYSNWMDSDSYLNSGNFVDANLFHGPDSNDIRNYLTTNVVWPLPVGQDGMVLRSAHGLLGGLLNHWMVDSAISYYTGYPLPLPSANLVGGPGCTSYVPAGGQTRAHWFNNDESCYQTLNQWQTRTAPLDIGYLREPASFEWNFAVLKNFALPREGMFVTFRMDCSTCSNTPVFGAPNTTLSAVPTFVPGEGETGFGTLPLTQANSTRAILLTIKITF